MKKMKVFWSKQETEAFIRRTGALYLAAHGSWSQCQLEANRELPEARQRSTQTLASYSTAYRKRWSEMHAEDEARAATEAREDEARAATEARKNPQHDGLDAAREIVQARAAGVDVPDPPGHIVMSRAEWDAAGARAPAPDPMAQLADALLGAVRRVMHDELRTLSAELTTRLLTNQPIVVQPQGVAPSDWPPAPSVTCTTTSAPRKPKIVLVGMIGQQISQIKQDYGAKFDIVAHEATESNHLIAGRVATADKVLVNTGKIGHPLYAALRSRVPSERLVQFDGGVSSVRRILEAMA